MEEYSRLDLNQKPSKNFLTKCGKTGYQIVCIFEDGLLKNKYESYESHVEQILELYRDLAQEPPVDLIS
jgi:fibrillarin-like rRNA methylase